MDSDNPSRHDLKALLDRIRRVNQVLTCEHDINRLLQRVCEALVADSGYRYVCIFDLASTRDEPRLYTAPAGEVVRLIQDKLEKDELPECVTRSTGQKKSELVHCSNETCPDCVLGEHEENRRLVVTGLWDEDKCLGALVVALPDEVADLSEHEMLVEDIAQNVAFTLATLRAREHQNRIARAIQFVSEGIEAADGESVLRQLSRRIAEVLDSSITVIGRLIPDTHAEQVETVAVTNEGKLMDNFVYPLEGTPCADVAGKGICCYPKDTSRLFPDDAFLKDHGIEGYAGIPLRNSSGAVVGILAVMSDVPLSSPDFVQSVIHVCAVRASAELERMAMEQQLRQREERYRRFFEEDLTGDYETTVEGHLIDCNRAFLDVFGFDSLEHARNTDMRELYIEKGDRNAFLDSVRKNRKLEHSVIPMKRLDGQSIVIEENVVGVFDSSGELTGVRGYLMDVTERELAKQRLKQSEHRYRSLFSGSPDAIFLADPESGLIVDANPAAEELLARPYEEIVGMHQSELHAPGTRRQSKADFRSHLEHGSRDGEIQLLRQRIVRSDGTEVPVEIHARLVDYGERKALQGVFRNIGERERIEGALRESEAKFRSLVEQSLSGIYIIQGEKFVYVNPRFAEIFGFDSPEDLLAHATPASLVCESDRDRVMQNVRRRMTGDVEYVRHSFEGVRKDGSRITVEVHGAQGSYGGNPAVIGTLVDVTEQREIQLRVQESEEKFRMLAENTPVAIMIYQDDRFVYANPASTKISGYSQEELIGMEFWSFVHPDHREMVRVRGQERLKGKQQQNRYQFKILNRAGETRWIDFTGNRIQYSGKPGGIVVCIDITEQKRAEEALAQSEARFRELFDSSPISLWVEDLSGVRDLLIEHDVSTRDQFIGHIRQNPEQMGVFASAIRVLDVNRETLKLYHAKDADHLISELPNLIEEDGFRVLGEELETLLAGDSAFETEMKTRNLAGESLQVILRMVVPEGFREDWGRVIVSITDITERKSLERELVKVTQAVEKSPESIVITNPEGKIEYVNEAFTEITGYEPEEALGRNPRILKSGLTPDSVYEDLWATITKGRVWRGELSNRRKNGDIFWESVVISGVLNEKGDVQNYVAMKRDITEQKRLEAERVELEARLRQSQKLETVGTLAGGIAHDFNNLLTPIMGYAEMARLYLEDGSRSADYIDRILGAAERSRDLVRQMLMFSRRVEQEKRPVRIAPVVEEALKLVRASIPATVQIETDVDPDAGTILADPTQIHQVMMNLCTNAYQAMEPSGGTLTVELKSESLTGKDGHLYPDLSPGDYVRLTVSDTGTGMEQEVVQRVFEPFFTTKEPGKGTGLGLSVVHGVVVSHGGGCRVESTLGEGTTFHVLLPRIKQELSEDDKVETEMKKGTGTILLVDDEDMVRDLHSELLKQLGYEVIACPTAGEALAVMESDEADVDLVLTDLTMPQMTGLELAQRISGIRPDLPIILITGYDDRLTAENKAAAGIREVLMKPVTIKQLGACIDATLSPSD